MRTGFAEINGVSLWISERGSGAPLVLCSGGPGCADYLGPVAELIDDLATVYRYEPRGCGRSTADGNYDLLTAVRDLDALRDYWGYDRWIVAGHSWGADLALVYALEYPERVRALLFLAGPRIQNDRSWHAAYAEARDAGLDEELAWEFPHNLEVNRIGNDTSKAYWRQPAMLRRISELDMPALAIVGANDIRPSWTSEQVVALMRNARFSSIPDSAHHQWLTQRDELRRQMREFLTGLPENYFAAGR